MRSDEDDELDKDQDEAKDEDEIKDEDDTSEPGNDEEKENERRARKEGILCAMQRRGKWGICFKSQQNALDSLGRQIPKNPNNLQNDARRALTDRQSLRTATKVNGASIKCLPRKCLRGSTPVKSVSPLPALRALLLNTDVQLHGAYILPRTNKTTYTRNKDNILRASLRAVV